MQEYFLEQTCRLFAGWKTIAAGPADLMSAVRALTGLVGAEPAAGPAGSLAFLCSALVQNALAGSFGAEGIDFEGVLGSASEVGRSVTEAVAQVEGVRELTKRSLLEGHHASSPKKRADKVGTDRESSRLARRCLTAVCWAPALPVALEGK